MKITATKVIRELEKNYGYFNLTENFSPKELIKDILEVINSELIKHKNISIKK